MHDVDLKLVPTSNLLISDLSLIDLLIENNGPTIADIPTIRLMAEYLSTASDEIKLTFYEKLKPILVRDTLLGWTYLKPHGYAGDFQLIDKIHNNEITDIPHLKNWDLMYHELAACKALRNRKNYFNDLVDKLIMEKGFISILNLGSGPGRDIKEYLDKYPNAPIVIDCVDMDKNAIIFAEELNKDHLDKVRFFKKDVFRLPLENQYDLVWSAGLFDYFNDKLFSRLVKKYFAFVKNGGQLVLGNINTSNKDKLSMEIFGQWFLYHRSENDLKNIVDSSEINYSTTRVSSEITGVNIFSHTYKS